MRVWGSTSGRLSSSVVFTLVASVFFMARFRRFFAGKQQRTIRIVGENAATRLRLSGVPEAGGVRNTRRVDD